MPLGESLALRALRRLLRSLFLFLLLFIKRREEKVLDNNEINKHTRTKRETKERETDHHSWNKNTQRARTRIVENIDLITHTHTHKEICSFFALPLSLLSIKEKRRIILLLLLLLLTKLTHPSFSNHRTIFHSLRRSQCSLCDLLCRSSHDRTLHSSLSYLVPKVLLNKWGRIEKGASETLLKKKSNFW